MKKSFTGLVAMFCVFAMVFTACGTPDLVASSANSAVASAQSGAESASAATRTSFRMAGLKGPTSMGMVALLEDSEAQIASHNYSLEVYGTPDELNTKLIAGEIDVAAVPANLASVLYAKTKGEIVVAAINTLGVLYVVETGESIQSVEDLRGKTVYSTGLGSAPEYVMNYILSENGLVPQQDVTMEYKSEATEIAALLNAGEEGIAVLPQPYATIVAAQNPNIRIALNLTEEWTKVSAESGLVTGVLVVRKSFVQENEAAFAQFLQEYKQSIDFVNSNPAVAAKLIVGKEIFSNAEVVEKALPLCNIVYIDGAEMKEKLSGYLKVMFEQEPKSVGGVLPDDAFYWAAT